MSLIQFLLRASRRTVLIAILAGLAGGVCTSLLIALIHSALSSGRRSSHAWAFAGLCAGMLLTKAASQIFLTRLSQGAFLDLRMRLSRQILAAPLRTLEEAGLHRLMVILTDDVLFISNSIIGVPLLCINVSIVLGCLLYLGWLSGVVLFAVLCFILAGVAIYRLLELRALRYLRTAREEQDALFGNFRGLTEGNKELKLNRRRRLSYLLRDLQPSATSLRDHNIRGLTIYIAAVSWGQLLFFVFLGLLIFVLPEFADISTPTLTGYTLTILYLMTPLESIMSWVPILGRAKVALQKVESLGLSLAHVAAGEEEESGVVPGPSWRRLDLLGVTHTYRREGESSDFLLGPVSLSLSPGEIVFLVGGNGSGKTTLVKLVTGLYAPEEGVILFDGEPVGDDNRDDYRQHFSAVFSDFYLFENLPESAAGVAPAQRYLEQFRLGHKVAVDEGRLSTTALSQGERKRLALLAAYLEDRQIYVFDEWASDQDPVFKDVFYHQLLPDLKAKGKAVLVVTHDDRYFHLADRLIKLDYGKVDADRLSYEPEVSGLLQTEVG